MYYSFLMLAHKNLRGKIFLTVTYDGLNKWYILGDFLFIQFKNNVKKEKWTFISQTLLFHFTKIRQKNVKNWNLNYYTLKSDFTQFSFFTSLIYDLAQNYIFFFYDVFDLTWLLKFY